MRYTNSLKQTVLLCGLTVAPICLANEVSSTKSCYNQPRPQIEVKFLYSIDGGPYQELKEGTALHTGKDRYQIVFTPKQDYIITVLQTVLQTDSKGTVSPLIGADRKPVEMGKQYTLPKTEKTCGGKTAQGYCLDGPPGKESLYFIACPYDGAKVESKWDTFNIENCNGSPCVKSVTFEHVD